jgi:hypothetical protein
MFFKILAQYTMAGAIYNSFCYTCFKTAKLFPESMYPGCKRAVLRKFFAAFLDIFVSSLVDIKDLYFQFQQSL